MQLPSRLQKLRRLERDNRNWAYLGGGSKLFFEQARLCADFTCDLLHDVDGPISWVLAAAAFPSYKVMNDEELVRYFCWRTRLRANETPKGPAVFLFVVSFELLVGVGAAPGEDTLAELSRIAESYRGVSEGFDSRISRWMYDYAIYHGLDATALKVGALRTRMTAVSCLRGAETALIRRGTKEGWPDRGAESLGLPSEGELLDALCSLSRYRAEKSRLVRGMRDDVALVCARVFARMVDHCHRRSR